MPTGPEHPTLVRAFQAGDDKLGAEVRLALVRNVTFLRTLR